mgnify:CR=1 FL=1
MTIEKKRPKRRTSREEKEDEDGFQAGKQATDLGLSAADGRRAADGVRVRGVLCDQRHRAGRRDGHRDGAFQRDRAERRSAQLFD